MSTISTIKEKIHMTTTILTIAFGLIVAAAATFIGSFLTKKVTIAHWIVNLVFGALGAVAANQLLPGAYGPVVFDLSIIPMTAGCVVLAGVGSWVVNKLVEKR